MLQSETNVFRANICPTSFHENGISSFKVSQNPQHTNGSVLRRLASSESIQKNIVTISIEMPKSSDFPIVLNKENSSLEPKQSITYLGAEFLFHQ